MAKKKSNKPIKEGQERNYITKEELRNMKFELSIDVPKKDFDELLKAMMEAGKTANVTKAH